MSADRAGDDHDRGPGHRPVSCIGDGRDSTGGRDWLFVRPLAWRLEVGVGAIAPFAAFRKPFAAFRKALRMWLPAPRSRSTRSTSSN